MDATNSVLRLICSEYFHDETDDHPKFDIVKQSQLIEKELGLSHLTKRALEQVVLLRDYGHQHIYYHWLMKYPERNGACHAIIVTEYLDASLQQLWTQQGHKPMKVGRQIGSALEFLHSKKVVHHDVKTMIIMRASSDLCKRLIDLGLAKKNETSSHECAIFAAGSRGTDFYILFEVATAKKLSTKCNPYLQDSYALGMTLSCILLGLEKIKPYFSCSYNLAFAFEQVFLQRQAYPRAPHNCKQFTNCSCQAHLFIDDFWIASSVCSPIRPVSPIFTSLLSILMLTFH